MTTRVDDNGQQHTKVCWDRAEGTLMDELVTQALAENITYLGDDGTDYRIPAWGTTQQRVVATWLSDGTASCACDED